MIRESKKKTNTIVTGVAASMGSVIALAGNNRREITPMSRMMIHRAKGGKYGDHEDMADYGKLLFDINDDFIQLYVDNSNRDIEYVRSKWMGRGQETWLNARECAMYGLLTEAITVPAIAAELPIEVQSKGVEAVVDFFAAQMSTPPKIVISNTKMDKVTALLGLAKEANEDAVVAAIQKQLNDQAEAHQKTVDELQAKIDKVEKDRKRSEATSAVDAAIAAGKVVPGQKESLVKMYLADPDAAKAFLDSLQARKPIQQKLQEQQEKITGQAEKTFDWYQKNDPDALAEIREKDPERFESLVKEYNKKRGG